MIKQLQKIFPSLLVYQDNFNYLPDNYQWFITDTNEIIGIDKNELTKKDTSLLTTFLTPYSTKFPILTEEEQHWKNIINSKENPTNPVAKDPYRFVYFSIKKNQIEPKTFKESFHEFFTEPVPILWENEHEGIIIEKMASPSEENISYEQIIDVLMSDLYVKIKFFVGPYLETLHNVNNHYLSLVKSANIAFSYSEKPVVTYIDAIPYIFIDQADTSFREMIKTTVLKDFSTDNEMVHTIQTFIQCNLNISVTAKELYMHRNSLQYRLDKFIEKTGIDIRQFHQAMTVYLALVSNMHKN